MAAAVGTQPIRLARGREARTPTQVPIRGWKEVTIRAWREASGDNIGLIASGVAFCAVLALVPALGAIILCYGLIASPETVIRNVQAMTAIMPRDAALLVGEQMMNVVTTSSEKSGFGLIIALLIALYGAMKGAGAIMTALNIAYDEKETRSFVCLQLTTLAITVGAVLLAILAVIAIGGLGHLDALLPEAPGWLLGFLKFSAYGVMAAAGCASAAMIYRYGPDRDHARWIWLTLGSVGVTILWLAATSGFGIYVANFGSYDATYGSLGAAIVLLTWLYLSAYILLFGAELNCELERQTAQDTTAGPEQPLGDRGAYAADTVASDDEEPVQTIQRPDGAVFDRTISELGPLVAPRADDRRKSFAARSGVMPAVLATGGLAVLRRRGSAPLGVALLAAAAVFSWGTAAKRQGTHSRAG